MESVEPKSALVSKSIGLAVTTLGLAAFNIYRDYTVGGLPAISEADLGIVLTAVGLIIDRFLGGHARPLYLRKRKPKSEPVA